MEKETNIKEYIKINKDLKIEAIELNEDSYNSFYESIKKNAQVDEKEFQERMKSYYDPANGDKIISL